MYNIDFNPVLLSEIIDILEQDNEKIKTIITDVNNAMKDLDESKWKSPEKMHIDGEFMIYLNDIETQVPIQLNECTDFLKAVVEEYQKSHNQITTKIKEVDNNVAIDIGEDL